ncbi:hypothetical protein ABZ816_07195 [Actinosynnema sp. NPDC047251]|uniref:hypothetical protein n=1 Tax=Saccharothrix espanaensis TaxID=103731 RepID=UPI0011DD427F|nr:hypothetical protein [Saccharothrix espanaensis]
MSFGSLALVAGLVTGVALVRGEPESPPEQRIDGTPGVVQEPGGDGPPMEYRGGDGSGPTAARPRTGPPATTVGTRSNATEITPPTTAGGPSAAAVPEPSVSTATTTATPTATTTAPSGTPPATTTTTTEAPATTSGA